MKFDFPKRIRSGYLAAFILLLLCYFLSLSSFIQLRKQNNWVGHTREVINQLAVLNSNLKDAEINWSEFLVSKQTEYLEAYKDSRAIVDSFYLILSGSVSDNPAEKKRLESMHDKIVKQYYMLDRELEIFNRNHFLVNDSIQIQEQKNNKLLDSIAMASDSRYDE